MLGIVWCLLFVSLSFNCAWAAGETVSPVYHFGSIHRHPWFLDVLVSSAVGWALGKVRGFSGTQDWLGRYWQSVPAPIIFLVDFFTFAVVGGYLGTAIYDPGNLLAAIAAGLSWPLGLGALTTKD